MSIRKQSPKWWKRTGTVLSPNVVGDRVDISEIRAIDGNGLKLYDDGGNGIFVKDGGNIGIGTSSPSEHLEISGSGNQYILINSSGNEAGIKLKNSADSLYGWQIGIGTDGAFTIYDSDGGGSRLVVADDGNVGIGTTEPSTLFNLYSDANSLPATSGSTQTGNVMRIESASATALDIGLYTTAGAIWLQGVAKTDLSDTRHISLQPNAGKVGIGTTRPDEKLDVYGRILLGGDHPSQNTRTDNTVKVANLTAPHYDNSEEDVLLLEASMSSGNNSFQWGGSNSGKNCATRHAFYTATNSTTVSGTEKVRIQSDGKVGIGTTSPDTKLQVIGNTKFGDDNTNYVSFASDGEMSLTGTARVKKSMWLPFNALKAPGTKAATFVDHGISGAWEFSDGTDDTIVFNIQTPVDMDKTVAPTMLIGWSTNTTATSETCTWQLEYLWTSEGEDTTVAAQETLTIDSNAISQANGLIMAEITGIDLPSATDVCIHCRIKRLGAGENDDLTDTAELHGICFRYVSNKLGESI